MHRTSSSTFLGKLPLPDSVVLDGNDCGGGAARGDVDVALAAPAELLKRPLVVVVGVADVVVTQLPPLPPPAPTLPTLP